MGIRTAFRKMIFRKKIQYQLTISRNRVYHIRSLIKNNDLWPSESKMAELLFQIDAKRSEQGDWKLPLTLPHQTKKRNSITTVTL